MIKCLPLLRRIALRATLVAAVGIVSLSVSPTARATDPGATPSAKTDSFSIEATLVGGPNLNPNLEGRASPVVVRLFELRQTALFESASFSELFERSQEALDGEMVSQQEIVLRPGEIRHYDRTGEPRVSALGFVAAFRTLEKDAWRLIVPLAPGVHNLVLIDFDGDRIRAPSFASDTRGR